VPDLTIDQFKSRVRLFVGFILMAVVCISAWSIVSERNEVLISAERQAAGYARALAEHSESAFAESDRVLQDLLDDINRDGGVERVGRRELFQLLRRQAGDSPQIGSLFVVDKNGKLFCNSADFLFKPVNVADRDYFRYYLTTPGADLTISKPVMSRLVNRWRFNLIRPLNRPGEPFAGLLAVAFEVEYFYRFFSPASLGPHGRVMLIRTDGVPLVYEPYLENAYETDFRKSELLTQKLPVSPSGTYRVDHSLVDHASRIISYHRLSRFPVVAVVSLQRDDVLEPWSRKAMLHTSMTLGLCMVIVILARLFLSHLDRLRAAHALVYEQQEQLRIKAAQIDAADDAILQIDGEGRLVHFNQALCRMTGYTQEELTGIRIQDIEPPQFAEQVIPNIRSLQDLVQATFESAYCAKDGTVVPIEVNATVMESEGGSLILSIVRDITQRKRSELREQTRLKILEEMASGASLGDLLGYIVRFVEQENPGSLCSVLLSDESGSRLQHGAAPSLPEFYNQAVDGLLIGQGMGSCGTAAHLRQRVVVEDIEGHPFWKGFNAVREAGLRACWSEPVLSSDGELLGTFATYYRETRSPNEQEIMLIESAAHLASIAIGRVREEERNTRLEEQLRHMQKIEAIGQLAGGIAHDFNNLLTPIFVYAGLIRRCFSEEDPQLKKVDGVIAAAHKAKDLTQKLLSFGRKQMLSMEVLDLNDVLASFYDILRRTIREDIIIEIQSAAGGAHVLADRGQIEQILLNLAVNAQDAIAGNGKVCIETGHVVLDDEYARLHPGAKPGPYILLSFSDNGCGMEDDVLHHIFEPFFTTKAIGHGTGLGLATVYGIVKQHEGYIEVRSRVKAGTSFEIYLPASVAGNMPVEMRLPVPENSLQGSTDRTILVVEDNEMVRDMVVDLLGSSGFRVLDADTPSRAQEIECSHDGPINLLVTDVVMPEMNGPDLYERLLAKRPRLPVLYISGYTSDVVIHDGTLQEEVNFLKKPFTAEQFIERIRQVLDSQ
jgi:two-component system cell cycle sensor histidine kinase/response regulator CckA